MEDRQHLFIVNKNNTMAPSLRNGDVARIEPCDVAPICRGDLICFYRSIDHAWISRVVDVSPAGIHARGDNDAQGKVWLIQPDDIIGRVVWAYRGNRRVDVRNGRIGQLEAAAHRAVLVMEPWFSPLLHVVYYGLSRKGIFRRWLPGRLMPRVVAFERPKGTEYHVLIGPRLIGQLLPGEQWRIERPFRLFVEEKSLPE